MPCFWGIRLPGFLLLRCLPGRLERGHSHTASDLCYTGALFQESLQVIAQQASLHLKNLWEIAGAQESLARLRSVPHEILGVASPCRRDFLGAIGER